MFLCPTDRVSVMVNFVFVCAPNETLRCNLTITPDTPESHFIKNEL